MRTIRRTNVFKRDYGREKRGQYRQTLDAELQRVLELLIVDATMPERYHDHPMRGNRVRERNCHIRPDLILLYRKPDTEHLDLIRLGSHSELGI